MKFIYSLLKFKESLLIKEKRILFALLLILTLALPQTSSASMTQNFGLATVFQSVRCFFIKLIYREDCAEVSKEIEEITIREVNEKPSESQPDIEVKTLVKETQADNNNYQNYSLREILEIVRQELKNEQPLVLRAEQQFSFLDIQHLIDRYLAQTPAKVFYYTGSSGNSSVDTSNFVTHDNFSNQIDATYYSLEKSLQNLNTTGITEGSNLFYTDQRVSAYISASSTLSVASTNYWTKTGSELTYTAGDVGIGTTSPEASLHIDGQYPLVLAPRQTAGGGGVGAWIYYGTTDEDYGEVAYYDTNAELRMWSVGATSINYEDLPNSFYIYQYRDANYTNLARWAFVINDDGNVGVGTSSPYAKLSVKGDGTLSGVNFQTTDSNNTPLFTVLDNGNVGIGTTSPNQQLELTGSMRIPNTISLSTGVLYKASERFLHNFAASNTTGKNTFLGEKSGNFTMARDTLDVDASYNVGVGYFTLQANTSGWENTAIGALALLSNTTGRINTAVGFDALRDNTTGWQNQAFGQDAMISNTTGSHNTALSSDSLYTNTTGNDNTAAGVQSLFYNLSGNNNVAIGVSSLLNSSTGSDNTGLGYYSGLTNTSGSRNVFLGAYAGYYETGSDKLFIDNRTRSNESDARSKALIYGVFDAVVANQILTINGNVGIGTTTPAAKLNTYTSGADYHQYFETPSTRAYTYLYNNATGAESVGLQFGTETNHMMQFFTSNSVRISISGTGDVGIGTASPASKLDVNGVIQNSAANGFAIGNASSVARIQTSGSNFQFLKSDSNAAPLEIGALNIASTFGGSIPTNGLHVQGRVGIGTTTPSSKLHVVAGDGETEIAHFSSAAAAGASAFIRFSNGSGLSDLLRIGSAPTTGESWINSYAGLHFGVGDSSATFGNAEKMTLTSGGNLGIGTITPSFKLHVAGGAVGLMSLTNNEGGGVYACVLSTGEVATSSATCGSSSRRFKDNVEDLSYGLDAVLALRPVSFDYNEFYGFGNLGHQIGFIAEEVEGVIPELIGYHDGRVQSVDYPKFTAVIVNAVKELYVLIVDIKNSIVEIFKSIEKHDTEIQELKDRIEYLEARQGISYQNYSTNLDVQNSEQQQENISEANEEIITEEETDEQQVSTEGLETEDVSDEEVISEKNSNKNTENSEENLKIEITPSPPTEPTETTSPEDGDNEEEIEPQNLDTESQDEIPVSS